MNKLSAVKRVSRYVNEDKAFWQKHIKGFESSGLSGAGYCRKEGINWDRFNYWKKSLSLRKSNSVFKKGNYTPPKASLPAGAI